MQLWVFLPLYTVFCRADDDFRAFGLDFQTALSGATSISNVGPGLGDVIGPAGDFSDLPAGANGLCVWACFLAAWSFLQF